MTGAAARAWYVYGLASIAMQAPEAPPMLPDERIEALPFGRFAVFASRVWRELFDQDDPARRTSDPDWMMARAGGHHAVTAAAAAAGPFLPLPLGSLFSTLDVLREWVRPREAALEAALARVADQAEWVVALQSDRSAQAIWVERHDPTLRALAQSVAAAGKGTAFLLSRRLDTARASALAAHASGSAATVEAALAAYLPRAETTSGGLPAWTVLVPRVAPDWPDRLTPLADTLEPAGLSLRVTGPWPAYGFTRAALATASTNGSPDV
jgi:hypothetical protein